MEWKGRLLKETELNLKSNMIPDMGGFLTSVFLFCFGMCFFFLFLYFLFLKCVYPILYVIVCNSHLMKMKLSVSVYERSKFWELERVKSLSLYAKNPHNWETSANFFFPELNFLIQRGWGLFVCFFICLFWGGECLFDC